MVTEINLLLGNSFHMTIGCVQSDLNTGVVSPLDITNQVFWAQYSTDQKKLVDISEATYEVLSDEDIADLKYDGDKTDKTWIRFLFPALTLKSKSFALEDKVWISIFHGSSFKSADARVSSAVYIVNRIKEGPEGILDSQGNVIITTGA